MVDEVVVAVQRPVDPRGRLDVQEDVAAAGRGDKFEHLLRATEMSVNSDRSRFQRRARQPSTEKVSAETHADPQPLDRRQQRRASTSAAPAGRFFCRHRADVEHLETGIDPGLSVRIACSGVTLRAPSNIESAVTLTIRRPPAAPGSVPSEAPDHPATVATAPWHCRCVYTDLDGTLLGQGSSLFRDAEGGFSLAQARGLEACQRAGVEA